jgi:hypothetical protein
MIMSVTAGQSHSRLRNAPAEGPGRTCLLVPHRYSAAVSNSSDSNTRVTRDELLVTNYPDVPDSDRYRPLM